MHNSVPEYRISFWKALSALTDLTIVITERNLEEKIYNFEKDIQDLKIKYWNPILLKYVHMYDAVILPPVESLKDYIIARKIRKICIKSAIPFFYWTEKWIPDKKVDR